MVHGFVFGRGFVFVLGLLLVFVVIFVILMEVDSVLSRVDDLVALEVLAVGRDCFKFSNLGARYTGGKSSSRGNTNRLAAVEMPNFSFSLLGLLTDMNLSIAPFVFFSLASAFLATAFALMNFFGFLKDSS